MTQSLVRLALPLLFSGAIACSLRNVDRLLTDAPSDGGPLPDGAVSGEPDGGLLPCVPDELCALDIAAGERHACVVLRDGRTACWGANESNQLATAERIDDSPVPVESLARAPATAIRASSSRTCIVLAGGGIRCWGNKNFGVLGAGDPVSFEGAPSRPVLRESDGTPLTGVTSLVLGQLTAYAQVGTEVYVWGLNEQGSFPLPPPRSEISSARLLPTPWPVAAIGAGYTHACFLDGSGKVFCFGPSTGGQLGSATEELVYTPTEATWLEGRRFVRISPSTKSFTCGVDVAGTLVCWGTSSEGATGILDPMPFDVAKNVEDVVCRGDTTCAITKDRRVVCLGNGEFGALGRGGLAKPPIEEARRPEPVVDLTDVVKLAMGDGFTCALTRVGAVRCWGKGTTGALGDGAKADSGKPVRVRPLP